MLRNEFVNALSSVLLLGMCQMVSKGAFISDLSAWADMGPSPRPKVSCKVLLKEHPDAHLSIHVCAILEAANSKYSDPSRIEVYATKKIKGLKNVRKVEIKEDKFQRFFEITTTDGGILQYGIKDLPNDAKVIY